MNALVVATSRCEGREKPWVPSTKETCYACKCDVWVSDATKKDVAILIAARKADTYVPMCTECVLEGKDTEVYGSMPDEVHVGPNTIEAVVKRADEEDR